MPKQPVPERVLVSGSLARFADGFRVDLIERGYSLWRAQEQVYLLAHVSRWMEAEGLELAALTPATLERYFVWRRRQGYRKSLSPLSLRRLLGYLDSLGVLPADDAVPSPVDELLAEFRRYQLQERGVSARTVGLYEPVARLFLSGRSEPIASDLARLSGAEVNTFVLREARRRSARSAEMLASGLRALLRFLYAQGVIAEPLAAAVPSVACRREDLPRGIAAGQVRLLLDSCDRATPVGRRDYAIVLLLSRLGLRCGEVAGLDFEDVDWRASELVVRGKGSRQDTLPLSSDVGEALVDYLRHGRRRGFGRAVFLHAHAPVTRLSPGNVSDVVKRACKRAGIARVGAHRLRHTVASELLSRGAGLVEIGQVLRHQDLRTTALVCQGRPAGAVAAGAAVAGEQPMIPLGQAVDDYLAMRRALGYKLIEHGRVLPQFAEFLAQRGESLITIELALEFAMQPAGASVVWWHQRLAIVRGFARYLQVFDARHEVPPVNLLPAKFRRAVPYLFSEAEIEALMHAARSMSGPLRAASCEALIGLLAVTGMRVSEACALDRSDMELGEGRLTVRQGKNGRSREIPLHASSVEALERYARARDQLCPHPTDPTAFFLSGWGGRPGRHHVWRWFDQLRRATGLDRETLGRQPRLHDVRHTFVLRTLLGFYREADDIEAQLPLLATVLGHVDPADTYWYLEGAPDLLALAAERLERTWEEPVSPAPTNDQPHPAASRRWRSRPTRPRYRRGGR